MNQNNKIWKLAEKAEAEISKWPEWKKMAADRALVTQIHYYRDSGKIVDYDKKNELVTIYCVSIQENIKLSCTKFFSGIENRLPKIEDRVDVKLEEAGGKFIAVLARLKTEISNAEYYQSLIGALESMSEKSIVCDRFAPNGILGLMSMYMGVKKPWYFSSIHKFRSTLSETIGCKSDLVQLTVAINDMYENQIESPSQRWKKLHEWANKRLENEKYLEMIESRRKERENE